MGALVQLRSVMDAIDLPEGMEALLDPSTGEVLVMTDEERDILDGEDVWGEADLEMPEWEREAVARLRELVDSGRALSLPDRFDFHEWEVMRQFALSVEGADESAVLFNAIHSSGAFRRFRAVVAELGLRERWFEYRDLALGELAKEWLGEHGIEFTEEAARSPRTERRP